MRPAVVAAFLAAVFPLVATPGASLTLLIQTVTTHGRRHAAPVILGTVTGLYVHASLAIAGLSELVMHSSEAFATLRILGAGYLVVLGLRTWRGTPAQVAAPTLPGAGAPHPEMRATYRRALIANVLNPKAASIFLTLVPQFLTPSRAVPEQILTLATAQGALIATWLLGWTILLTRARRLIGSPRAREIWNRASALTLITLGVRTAVL
jgi:threonine/homoserine/homoserine lactone efflux protein